MPQVTLNPKRGWASAWGLFALAAATQVSAQPVTEKSFFEELPVVLSASRIPQSLAATPGAVTVLDREFIRATGYRDIPSLLKLVPGFHVVIERGGMSHVTYHGLGNAFPNRMQVLIDGRSVYSPYQLGGVDWFAVPITIDEIERIEVLRGSNSATYGSNAFLGVVNIVTREAGDRPGSDIRLSAGNNGLRDVELRHDLRRGDLGLRFNAEVRYDNGLPALVDPTRKGVATVRGDYQLNARDELSFWAGVNESRRGLGYGGTPGNTNGLRALRAENGFAHLQWRRVLGPDDEIKLGYYHNEERAKDEYTAYSSVPIDFNRTSDRDNLDFQHLFSPSARTRMAWGVELRRDAIRSSRMFFGAGEVRQTLARGFANLEWRPLSALTVNAGAMAERYSGREPKLAPRLFANWQVVPGHTLRIGRSIAFRAPSLAEERGDVRFYSGGYSGLLLRVSFVGDPSIGPERVAADEIGYLARFRTWDGVFDLRVYRERITDLIQEIALPPSANPEAWSFCSRIPVFVPPAGLLDPRTAAFCNSALPVMQRGFEWHYGARPAPGTQLRAGYSHLMVRAPFSGLVREREAPRHVVSLTWLQAWAARWNSTVSVIHYSPYEWGSGSLTTSRYTSLDARLTYHFGTSARPVELGLVLLNLGRKHDEFYPSATIPGGNAVPRVAFLTARFGI